MPSGILQKNILPTFSSLIIGRFLQGIGIGIGANVAPVYIREISPLKMCGSLGACHQLWLVFAILFPMFLTLGIPQNNEEVLKKTQIWRAVFLFPLLISTIQLTLITSVYIFDSPKFYIEIGNSHNAMKALSCIYSDRQIQEKILSLIQSATINEKNNRSVTCKELFGPLYRWALIIGILTAFFQQATGFNAIAFYSTSIFSKGGHSPGIPNVLFSIINFSFTLIATITADRFGRKTLLIIGSFFIAVFMIIIGKLENSNYYFVTVIFILLFVAVFSISHGPICWVYSAEILPPPGFSIGAASNFFFTLIIGFITPLMINNLNLYFYTFSGFMILSLIFIIFFFPETKGLNEKEIRMLFCSSESNNSSEVLIKNDKKEKEIEEIEKNQLI